MASNERAGRRPCTLPPPLSVGAGVWAHPAWGAVTLVFCDEHPTLGITWNSSYGLYENNSLSAHTGWRSCYRGHVPEFLRTVGQDTVLQDVHIGDVMHGRPWVQPPFP